MHSVFMLIERQILKRFPRIVNSTPYDVCQDRVYGMDPGVPCAL